MKPALAFVFFILFFSHAEARGKFRPAKCEVQPLWVSKEVRSSNFGLMGTFEKDGSGGLLIRSFRLKDTPLVATVGIDYVSEYSKILPRPYAVRLAITVSDKEEEKIFEVVNSSEAETLYSKKWSLSVTKNVFYDNRIFMFSLRCWDAAGFAGKRPLY